MRFKHLSGSKINDKNHSPRHFGNNLNFGDDFLLTGSSQNSFNKKCHLTTKAAFL